MSLSRLSWIPLPADVAAVVFSTLVIDVLVSVVLRPGEPLRLLVGLPLLFFLPGYALVAALFPARPSSVASSADDSTSSGHRSGIDDVERVVLSVGLSAAILPLIGMALSVTPDGLSSSIVSALSLFVFVTAVVAAVRRARLPSDERFSVSVRERSAAAVDGVVGVDRRETAINVALAVSVALAVVALGVAVAAPQPSEQYSELSLLTESNEGELVAADYPNTISGETEPLVVGVENQEDETRSYTVVVQLERVADDGSVTERSELTRMQPTVAPGEQWTTRHSPNPSLTGDDLRLTYLLYQGDPPAEPTQENAYREVHLWVDAEAE